MALLRNREVQILGKADGTDVSPVYTVMYSDGNRENVELNKLHLTKDEYDKMLKANGEVYMHNVQKVEDKDLQEIRDGQNKEKIEAKQSKQTDAPVPVSQVMVNPAEVAQKSTVKPVDPKAKK